MWKIRYSEKAKKFLDNSNNDLFKKIMKGIIKVSHNPLPKPKGYGKPLGNKRGNNLTGFFKIKYKKIGIRVVYTLVLDSNIMNIIVIDERNDEHCYKMASEMYSLYGKDIFKDIFDN